MPKEIPNRVSDSSKIRTTRIFIELFNQNHFSSLLIGMSIDELTAFIQTILHENNEETHILEDEESLRDALVTAAVYSNKLSLVLWLECCFGKGEVQKCICNRSGVVIERIQQYKLDKQIVQSLTQPNHKKSTRLESYINRSSDHLSKVRPSLFSALGEQQEIEKVELQSRQDNFLLKDNTATTIIGRHQQIASTATCYAFVTST